MLFASKTYIAVAFISTYIYIYINTQQRQERSLYDQLPYHRYFNLVQLCQVFIWLSLFLVQNGKNEEKEIKVQEVTCLEGIFKAMPSETLHLKGACL